ncbi:MAG: DUF86 domain-containing protein [bacterium]
MKADLPYLGHIRDALLEIRNFVEGMTYEQFRNDRRTQNAVMRSFEVMGEASRRVSPEFRAAHSEIPWRTMMDFRNKLIHDYFGLDLFLIWQSANEDVPPLLPMIEKLLADS